MATKNKGLLFEAREICARFAEFDGNPRPAENYRAGLMDDSYKVRTALAALRRAVKRAA